MNMIKVNRCIALILMLVLLCGTVTTVRADVATLGIYFCGRRTAEDGSETIIRLEGRFRVYQNGEEVGIIEAGKETLTLNGTERIRIEPMTETIVPGWDLRSATREVTAEAGGTTTISVVVEPLKESSAKAQAIPMPEEKDQNTDRENAASQETQAPEDDTETEPEEAPAVRSGPVVTPTLPPFDANVLAPTPEPAWKSVPAGSGTVRVCAFHDRNDNGLAEDSEPGVSDVTICLFTEDEEAIASVKTGKDGMAEFGGLPEGQYRIKAILPNGWAFHKKGTGEDYASVFGYSIEGEAMSGAFRVNEGAVSTAGISLDKCLHVTGACWFETTIDGLYEDGETPLPGVRIEMNGEKNGLHYETVSGADGNWYIDRVAPAARWRRRQQKIRRHRRKPRKQR